MSRFSAVDDCIAAMTAARDKKRGLTMVVLNGHGRGRLSRLASVVAGMLGMSTAMLPSDAFLGVPQAAPPKPAPDKRSHRSKMRAESRHMARAGAVIVFDKRDPKYLNSSRTQRPDGSDW